MRTFRQVHIQPCSRKWKKALVHVNILNFGGFWPKLVGSLLGAATAMLLTAPANGQTVPIDSGLVKGDAWNGSLVFRGIPFAAPPLGPLRWKPPQPVRPWHNIRASVRQPA